MALSTGRAVQPWDRDGWVATSADGVPAPIAPVRDCVLREMQGHYPAPLAILECVEQGLLQLFDGAIRSEMAIFAHPIQREEPRNMIATLFLAKIDYERLRRNDALPPFVASIIGAAWAAAGREDAATLAAAGFSGGDGLVARPTSQKGYWIERGDGRVTGEALARVNAALAVLGEGLSDDERRLADYAVVAEAAYPAYLDGPYAYARRLTAGA